MLLQARGLPLRGAEPRPASQAKCHTLLLENEWLKRAGTTSIPLRKVSLNLGGESPSPRVGERCNISVTLGGNFPQKFTLSSPVFTPPGDICVAFRTREACLLEARTIRHPYLLQMPDQQSYQIEQHNQRYHENREHTSHSEHPLIYATLGRLPLIQPLPVGMKQSRP